MNWTRSRPSGSANPREGSEREWSQGVNRVNCMNELDQHLSTISEICPGPVSLNFSVILSLHQTVSLLVQHPHEARPGAQWCPVKLTITTADAH